MKIKFNINNYTNTNSNTNIVMGYAV